MKACLSVTVTAAALTLAIPLLAVRPTRSEPNSSPGPQLSVIRASNAWFSEAIRVTGFLVPREEAIVTFGAPGQQVVEVLVGEGDRVIAGQTLARLTSQAREGPGAGPASITLLAPAAGLIMRSTAEVGATASPMASHPLFRIAVDSEIELEADVPSIHVPVLKAGQTASVDIGGSRELSGRVRLVPAAVDERTQLGRARVSLEHDPSLRLGMFARATINANRSCGLSVPRSAVRYRTEGTSVQIVHGDVIETRPVQVGIHSDTDMEIRDGIREGDMVVVNAGSSLRDGDKVTPVIAIADRAGRC
jgi:multidrug efflux pump subunit AcrA (membrane-fusion protein)